MIWNTEEELFTLMKHELFTAVVGDVMDGMGLIRQFLPPQIRPLREDMILVGKAMPVLEADCHDDYEHHQARKMPFGLMFEALDDLHPHEVYISAGSSPTYAQWGELMSTRAIKLGSAGAVVHGYSRDTKGILKLNFPTFSFGPYAQDQRIRGRVIDFRCPLEFPNNVIVYNGDVVFGDIDGVVVIPSHALDEVIQTALEKVRGENLVRNAFEQGMPSKEAFEHYGIM